MAGSGGVYRAGNNPGGSTRFAGASPDAFGAGVGQAISKIGDVIQDKRVQDHALETRQKREDQGALAGVDMAKVMGDTTTDVQEMRVGSAPGAAGHTEAVAARVDERLNTFLGTITDEHVRNQYKVQAAQYRARVIGEEDGWQRGQAVEYRVSNIDTQGTALANIQATHPSADGLADSLGQIKTAIALQEVPPGVKDKLVKEQSRKVVMAWGNALQTSNHEGLLATLDSGALNQYLEPEDIDRLRSGAIVEGRRAAAAQKAVIAETKATLLEDVRMTNARLGAGDYIPDDELEEKQKAYAGAGLEVESFNIGVARSRNLVNRETRDWTPQQFGAEINTLRAKGDNRTQAENVRMQQLEQIQGPRISEFNRDPQGHAARVGNPAPALDLAAPTAQSLSARVSWAQGYAKANGLVNAPYLSDLEMKLLRDRAEQGPAGRLEVAQQLRGMFGASIGGKIAGQMAPNDRAMLLAVGLPTTTANTYTRGLDALKRNGALKDDGQEQEIFREVAPAIPQALRTPVFEAARAIAAGLVDTASGDKFNEDTYRNALHLAMGATSQGGGLAGGIGYWRHAPVWLPPGVSQGELERRVSRASPQSMVDAAGGIAPHYWDQAKGKAGRALTATEIRSMQFETVRPGVFRVKGPIGGVLTDAKGRPWEMDVSKLK